MTRLGSGGVGGHGRNRDVVRIWDLTGNQVGDVGPFPMSVQTFAFHPIHSTMVVATNAFGPHGIIGEVSTWYLDNEIKSGSVGRGHSASITGIAYLAESRDFVTASEDRSLIVWNGSTAQQRFTVRGHSHPITVVASRPDRPEVLTATQGRPLPTQAPAGIDPKQFVKVTGGLNDPAEIKIWDLGRRPDGIAAPGHDQRVTAIAFRPGSDELAVGHVSGHVAVWNTRDGRQVGLPPDARCQATIQPSGKQSLVNRKLGRQVGLLKHDPGVGALAYSPQTERHWWSAKGDSGKPERPAGSVCGTLPRDGLYEPYRSNVVACLDWL